MTTTTHPAHALMSAADRALLDVAPAIVDRLHAMFAARPLTATPAVLAARIAVDTSYSTPELALLLDVEDPTGVYGYDVRARLTGSSDGRHLWVDMNRSQMPTDDYDDAESIAAFTFGALISALPNLDDMSDD